MSRKRTTWIKPKAKANLIKCNECGKVIIPGNDENGIPHGVGFEMAGGRIINVCSECIIKKGREMEDHEDVCEG